MRHVLNDANCGIVEQCIKKAKGYDHTLPEAKMERKAFIKNLPFSEPLQLAERVEYEEGRVVSWLLFR